MRLCTAAVGNLAAESSKDAECHDRLGVWANAYHRRRRSLAGRLSALYRQPNEQER